MIYVSRRVEQTNLSVQLYASAFVYDLPFYVTIESHLGDRHMVIMHTNIHGLIKVFMPGPIAQLVVSPIAYPGAVSLIPAPYFCGD